MEVNIIDDDTLDKTKLIHETLRDDDPNDKFI